MKKYVCKICGYEYDEAAGDPKAGIAPNTKWKDLGDDWQCPLCGAPKEDFEEIIETEETANIQAASPEHNEKGLSFYEMSALCSNLAKGCEKQVKTEQAQLFYELANYFQNADTQAEKKTLDELREPVQYDIDSFAGAKSAAQEDGDRGALRALVWSEKVTKIVSSILLRYGKQKDKLVEGKNVYVCEICGFIYIGEEPPEVCPVCKVPNFKLKKIARR